MFKVAITDYTFAALEIEEGILRPAGCEVAKKWSAGHRHQTRFCSFTRHPGPGLRGFPSLCGTHVWNLLLQHCAVSPVGRGATVFRELPS